MTSIDLYQDIKSRLDLLTVITQETGLTMKGAHLEECPFCHGHSCFSRVPTADFQAYRCFQCGAAGDVFTFLEEFSGLSKGEALKRAAALANFELPETKGGKARQTNQESTSESDQEKALRLAADFYHDVMLDELSGGREWFIRKRGHTLDTVKKMQVGWSNGSLLAYLLDKGFKTEDLVRYGLVKVRKKKGSKKDEPAEQGEESVPVDFFWPGLAIFPVFDHSGKVITLTAKDPSKKFPDIQLAGVPKKWFLNHASLGRHETIIVEGQNDIASLMDMGIEAVGTCGAPGHDQITRLRNFCAGKTVYLWFDQDKQQPWTADKANGNGGASHIRYIYHGLNDSDMTVKIIVHQGEAKDPDEFIQGFRKSGKADAEIRTIIKDLKRDALDPLEWEIHQIALITDKKDRLEAVKARKLPQMVNAMESPADQEVAVDELAKAIGISTKAVDDLVNNAVDLYSSLQEQFNGDIRKVDAYNLTQAIFRWFGNGAGARFYKTADDRVFLYYQRRQYEIGNNLAFNTLMFQLTRLAYVEKPGPAVWYFLTTMANSYGEPVEMMSWMYTDREKDVVYLNLNSDHNKIVRLAPGAEPELIDNGTNEHGILLTRSPQMRHFQYLPTASEAEGFAALKTLLMDTTPAETHLRYFLVAWTASMFLMNLQSDRGLVQITAHSSMGKSKVAERISQLIYGESYVGKGTGAAETRVATNNPLMFLDNVENRNLTQGLVDFMLLLANSSHKPKAKSGSDHEVLYQKLDALAIITSIEPFPGRLPELVNRAFHIELDGQFKQHGYLHDEVMRAIAKNRNMILSCLLRMIALDVLPKLQARQDWSKFIQTQHGAHTKDRNNEHLCTMMVILEALLKRLPLKNSDMPVNKQAGDLLNRWILYWNEQERTTSVTSNTLLTLMDGLAKEIVTKIKGAGDTLRFTEHPEFKAPYPKAYIGEERTTMAAGVQVKTYFDNEYRQEFFITDKMTEVAAEESLEFADTIQRLEFIITAPELQNVFNRLCKNMGIRNPYEGPESLAARIRNDRATMNLGGWLYITDPKNPRPGRSTYKKSGSSRYWRFSKSIKVRD